MKLVVTFFLAAVALDQVHSGSIGHDKVQPFPQPEPVTISEKAAVKFKPTLLIQDGLCDSYAAVNAAGETNGGLKPTNGNSGCKVSILGSQVYGRSAWYNDVWAIMYAWYFPKDFGAFSPSRRHDWKSAVVWLNNPAFESPTILGMSMYESDDKFTKNAPPSRGCANGTTPSLFHGAPTSLGFPVPLVECADFPGGKIQDLIMWEQLTNEARTALNSPSFGEAQVPISDTNFSKTLEQAWPF